LEFQVYKLRQEFLNPSLRLISDARKSYKATILTMISFLS
jgi:hypothetical protein